MATIIIKDTTSRIIGLTPKQASKLAQFLSVKVPNYQFAFAFKNGVWDGKQYFLTRPANTFPTGLVPKVVEYMSDMYEVTCTIQDERIAKVYTISNVSNDFTLSPTKEPRQYQIDTINKVANNNVLGVPFIRGIINIATNGGKTVIAESIISLIYEQLKNNNERLLFLTHSKEIAAQARKSIIEDLNIPVGFIGNSRWSLDTVTVALIPTLYSRMKNETPEWVDLRNSTGAFIADECVTGDTLILLPNNSMVPIERIYNDPTITHVMSYNTNTSILEPKRILRKIKNPYIYGHWLTLTSNTDFVTATPNHRVYTQNRGYVRMDNLLPTDELRIHGSFSSLPLVSQSTRTDNFRYNLEIEDNHNYFANNILVSNCHHSSSDSWYKILQSFRRAYIRLGLTGTIDKSNPLNEMKLYACTGSVISKITNSYLISQGYSAVPVCILMKVNQPELGELEYVEAYQAGIVSNPYRNLLISRICKKEVESGNTVLILVQYLEQGEFILEELEELNARCYFTNGQLEMTERDSLLDKLRNSELDVLVASNILDEGVDVSGINAIIYARGMKSMKQLLQGIGRGLRVKSDGSKLRFYDFIDDTNTKLLEHSLSRCKTLQKEKFKTKVLDIDEYENMSWDEINEV